MRDQNMENRFHISPEDFEELALQARDTAGLWVEAKPKIIVPHLMAWCKLPEKDFELILFALETDCEKHLVLSAAGRKLFQEGKVPVVAAFWGEAWVATNPPKGKRPRDCNNRREALVVHAVAIDMEKFCAYSMPILRDEDGRIFPTAFSNRKSWGTPILGHFYRGFFNSGTES